MNILISDGYSPCCPNCFSNDLIYDFHHAELYCNECGLVVMDNTFQSDVLFDYSERRQSDLDEYLQNDMDMVADNHSYGDVIEAINQEVAEKKKIKKAKSK